MCIKTIVLRTAVALCGCVFGVLAASGSQLALPKISLFQALQTRVAEKPNVVFKDSGAKLEQPDTDFSKMDSVVRHYGKRAARVQGIVVLEDAATVAGDGARGLASARALLEERYGGVAGLHAYTEGVRRRAQSLATSVPGDARTFADLTPAQRVQAMTFFRAQPLAARAGELATLLEMPGLSASR